MRNFGALTSLLVAHVAAQTPNPLCIMTKCGTEVGKCMLDSMCRDAMGCIAKCGGANQSCTFQCTCDYETAVYDNLSYCMFNKNDCMGTKKGFDTWQKCRKDVKPLATYRDAPLTKDVARKILERGQDRGDWIVTKGLSAAYDCLDCQMNYWLKNSGGGMQYVANFKVHKSNGSTRYNQGNYQALEFHGEVSRYSLNASSDGGLFHEEDWRLIGADESDDPQWATMYYCGAAAGVGMAYEGAMLITPDGMMPKDSATVAKIDAIFKANGLDLKCYPNNSNCGDHPPPPTPQASQFFQIV